MKPRRKKSKKEIKAEKKLLRQRAPESLQQPEQEQKKSVPQKIILPQVITVRDFSEKLNLPANEIIALLIKNGVMANINESIDFETAQIIGLELGCEIVAADTSTTDSQKSGGHFKPRPPIVTVMGHVDHGKTKLLDTIRKTNVVAEEAGAITQQIGAYQVEVKLAGKNGKKKTPEKITFLDTPGHEAFSSLRAHGVNLTDIVVLVVAANDGIKPQTIEAISHARSAQVPMIVAINKIDLPDADPERVKRQLAEINLLPEEWGGKIPTVEISAREGKNINQLLELILLTAKLENIQADYQPPARGVVIESKILKGFGPVATVLIQKGILQPGEIVAVGETWAKIKALIDWQGRRVSRAEPGMPVQITGLKALPETGDQVVQYSSEKAARQAVKRPHKKLTVKSIIQSESKDIQIPVVNLILKADLSGSLKAITGKLAEIDRQQIKLNLIQQGVGEISETDVNLASASQAIIIGFKVKVSQAVRRLAENKKVTLKRFEVIYELLDFVTEYLTAQLPPKIIEKSLGKFKLLKIFHQFKTQAVVGGKIVSGKAPVGVDANHWRGSEKIGRVKIASLEKDKKAANELQKGQLGGAKIIKKKPFAKLKINDIIEPYKITKKSRSLRFISQSKLN